MPDWGFTIFTPAFFSIPQQTSSTFSLLLSILCFSTFFPRFLFPFEGPFALRSLSASLQSKNDDDEDETTAASESYLQNDSLLNCLQR